MAKGSPERRTISIHCAGCRSLLYRYRKGGTGGLVKCFVERIVEDRTAGDLRCPRCGNVFARAGEIAAADARTAARYFRYGLGIPPENIQVLVDEDVTLAQLRRIFGVGSRIYPRFRDPSVRV